MYLCIHIDNKDSGMRWIGKSNCVCGFFFLIIVIKVQGERFLHYCEGQIA